VDVVEFGTVLEPPTRGAGLNPPGGSHKRFAAFVSPTARVATKHRAVMADLSLAAGSETHAAHVKHLMLFSHANLPIPQLLYRPLDIQRQMHQYLAMIQQADVEGKGNNWSGDSG
jgi:hypothetical protein